MKKTLALLLALIMCILLFALTGCKKKNEDVGPDTYKEKYGYEAYVAKDADILGSWVENIPQNSKSQKTVWRFEESTTLNIVETVDGRDITTGCAYNFNEKTFELSYLILNEKKDVKVTVAFEGNTMTFTDESGQIIKTFTKQ